MEEIGKTKKRRKAHRGVVTKLLNKVETNLNEEEQNLEDGKLLQFATDLRERKDLLRDLDDTILDLMIE